MNRESTLEEILEKCKRFRIVSVGGAGTGKSSLINRVFKVEDAKVSHHKPGEADIYQEITSEENPRFVLHDSKGFEPASVETFGVVAEFLKEKTADNLELSERLHAVWLCIVTPTAGARIVEAGEEQFLKLANERQIPVVIVFTQYDRLVRTKAMEDRNVNAEKKAGEAFDECITSLKHTCDRLKIPVPNYTNVSVRKKHDTNIEVLVDLTRDVVKGELWKMWATAQMANVPLKVEACIDNGMNYYRRALGAGSLPGVGKPLLGNYLLKVHAGFVECWNFREGNMMLNSDEFRQLMLFIVQDINLMQKDPNMVSPPDVGRINEFVKLATSASASIAPPITILGLAYMFVKLVIDTVLENVPDVQRLFMAYMVDLNLVLQELFMVTLTPKHGGKPSWEAVQLAIEAYQDSEAFRAAHDKICSIVVKSGNPLDLNNMHRSVREMISQFGMKTH